MTGEKFVLMNPSMSHFTHALLEAGEAHVHFFR